MSVLNLKFLPFRCKNCKYHNFKGRYCNKIERHISKSMYFHNSRLGCFYFDAKEGIEIDIYNF